MLRRIGLVGVSLLVFAVGIAYFLLRTPKHALPRDFIAGSQNKDLRLRLVLLEGGPFQMGSDRSVEKDQESKHAVQLRPFYLGETEVPVQRNPSLSKARTPKPSSTGSVRTATARCRRLISWFEAVKFLNWLSEQDGGTPFYDIKDKARVDPRTGADGYRLPTEAEFEFALGTSKLEFQPAQTVVPVDGLPTDDHGLKGCTATSGGAATIGTMITTQAKSNQILLGHQRGNNV